jgi:hypothetical protein
MRVITTPSAKYLNECFYHDKKTDMLYWKERPVTHFANEHGAKKTNANYSGKLAGFEDGGRYRVRIANRNYLVKYIIHKMTTGKEFVEVHHPERTINSGRKNSSGYQYVRKNPIDGTFFAYIKDNKSGKRIYVGRGSDTPELAYKIAMMCKEAQHERS